MPRYTDDSRERVRDAVDFVAVVSARTELRKAGVRRYEGRCPFHDERTPSFGIDPVEKLYHCFGCGAGGDIFKFVMETENLGFGEALELLADRAGIELEQVDEDPRAAQKRGRRDRLLAVLERTAAFYVRMLWESPEAEGARAYLRERGLEEPVLREFRVGYSPAAWDKVVAGSARAGYTTEELLAAGLAQRARGRSGVIDRFRGRLMFPWADARGRVLGFGARALAPDDKPKYLNTAEGELFHKGRQVYGADLARVAAAKAGSVVLVEGYTDVIALHQAGMRHVVGSMGTAVTEEQGKELAKLAGTVQLALDADAAGQAAMLKASAALKRADERLALRVVPLPAGSDPADIVQREGAEAVAALVERSVPFVRWQVEHAVASADLHTSEGIDAALAAVAEPINALPQSVLREELVRFVAGRLGLSDGMIASALSGAAPVRPAGAGAPPQHGGRGRQGGGQPWQGRGQGGGDKPWQGRGGGQGGGKPWQGRSGAQGGGRPWQGGSGQHAGQPWQGGSAQGDGQPWQGSGTQGGQPRPGVDGGGRPQRAGGHGGGQPSQGGDTRQGAGDRPPVDPRYDDGFDYSADPGSDDDDPGRWGDVAPAPAAPRQAPAPAQPRFAGASEALQRRAAAEHAFLALCIAVPGEGARRLADPAADQLLATPLARRAAAHLREHLDAPSQGLAAEDQELADLVAELVVRAGAMEAPQVGELERATLMLQLSSVERGIAAARAATTPGGTPLDELARERQRVLGELRRLAG